MMIIINSNIIINNIIIMIVDHHCMITCARQLTIKFANSTMFMILDCKMMDITVKYKYTWSSLALRRIGRTPSMNTAAAKNPNKAPEILKSHEWLQKRGQPSLLRNEILNFIMISPIRSPKGFRPKPCKKVYETLKYCSTESIFL